VRLDGTPLSALPLAQVRSRLLLAHNGDRFFGATVRDELAGSADVTAEQTTHALDVASALDVVAALPDGLDTTMRGRGRTFSGGELQRLRLARALLAGADVTVLVEPTNAVDAYTEHTIAEDVAREHAGRADGRSTILFTVSPLLLQHAQWVAFVRDGRVVATGTHHELLEREPGYRDLMSRDDRTVGGPAGHQ
jgi:ABC-type multidrug transport system fused ATPase/permease subunit